jgi:metallophosphoesterase superfamily enzyme
MFLASPACLVLPAFSPFARGYDISSGVPGHLLEYFQNQPIQTYAASSTRVVHLGELNRAIERMFAADRSAPALFRRRPTGTAF